MPSHDEFMTLFKLMSTVGCQLQSDLKAKLHMNAYFERMFMLSQNVRAGMAASVLHSRQAVTLPTSDH